MSAVLRIAIVGAESTGKTALAQALAARLATETGLRVSWVPEWLRQWCDAHGRTPQAREQRDIARAQHARIEAAAAAHDIVVCDTSALMTAVYSRYVFGDRALDDEACTLHRSMALTLLTALDLPWEADRLRDGPQVRAPVDAMLRELMLAQALPWALVAGQGPARLDAALAAVWPLLGRPRPAAPTAEAAAPRSPAADPAPPAPAGVFSRLVGTRAVGPAWVCGCCAWPEGERAELAARTAGRGAAEAR